MGPCARSRSESPSRAGLPAPACAFSPRRDGHRQHDHLGGGGRSAHPGGRAEPCRARRGALGTPRSRASATWSSALSTRTRPIPPTRSTCSRRWAASTSLRCAASLGAAVPKAPALLDGVISCTAALCAARLCPNALGYPRGHPRIKRTRKPGAPSRARHKGAPRRRHALGRGRGRHGVSPPSGFGAARVPGWEDVHGDWHGCLRAFRGGK